MINKYDEIRTFFKPQLLLYYYKLLSGNGETYAGEDKYLDVVKFRNPSTFCKCLTNRRLAKVLKLAIFSAQKFLYMELLELSNSETISTIINIQLYKTTC